MAEFPYYCWFPGDFAAKTHQLSTFEKGVYRQLLDCAWNTPDCSLPNDDVLLARFAGIRTDKWRKMKPMIMPFWDVSGDQITNKRLLKERARCARLRERAVKGASARHSKAVCPSSDVYEPPERALSSDDKPLKDNGSQPAEAVLADCSSKRQALLPTPTPTVKKNNPEEGSKKNTPPKSKLTLCPEDWMPKNSTVDALRAEGRTDDQIKACRFSMIDWSRGGGKMKRDWDATFRNWVRRDHPDQKPGNKNWRKAEFDAAKEATRKDFQQWNRPTTNQPAPSYLLESETKKT